MYGVYIVIIALFVGGTWAQATKMTGLHVVGNQIFNGDNKTVLLRGVNRPGTEYSCVQYGKIFDGPSDQSSIDAMMDWKINVVRVPINEDCWLGTGGADPSLSGVNYTTPISAYIEALTNSGLAVIVDLHWTSSDPGGNYPANQQTPMPDRLQAPVFWTSVANKFKNNLGVIFDVFNEPFPDYNAWDTTLAWTCWNSGEGCPNITYQAAGMQELVDAIRATGAVNIVMVGGIQYATSLTEWNDYRPSDATGNIAAAVHVYDFNFCRSRGCWDIYWAPIMANVPLIAGEAGETDCGTDFIYDFMNYADTRGVHYVTWAWLPNDCATGPSLITDYSGDATPYGLGFKTHLDQLSKNDVPPFSYTFPIFKDARSHWVDNWSSTGAILAFNETKIVHSGAYSIMFEPVVGYSLFFQCWGCIDTTLHKGIEFYINGGDNSGQQLEVVLMQISDLSLVAAGTSIVSEGPMMPIANLTSNNGVLANKWQMAYFDLSLVPAGKYDGIRFRSSSVNDTAIYLDDLTVLDKHTYGAASRGAACGLLVVVMCCVAVLFGW